MTPTQRSLKKLRDEGWTVGVVEKWNPHARIRQDLFGIFDLIAISPVGILAIQTTTGSNLPERLRKIEESPASTEWLEAGGLIEIHGWRKVGDRGKRKLWDCRVVPVTLQIESPNVPS